MIFNFLSRVWTGFAPGLGNHLWQSTLFAAAVAALTLAFRRNRAGVRYGLWMAASLKFLVPFSFLTSLGGYFGSFRAHSEANEAVYSTIVQLSQPFGGSSASAIQQSTPEASALQATLSLLPLLMIVWLVGALVVFAVWIARWYRVSAIARRGTPLLEGIEVEVVERLQCENESRPKVEIVSTTASIEPGIFGIVRPVLLWPDAMRGQVTEAHIESIVEHELCHVRRRDNLTAMVHMLVEALFWFHPFVWWIGGRLVEDRERACDEAVVESGRERRVYAESILKVCEFCVESPLPCVPGVSGADLKRRIAMIMSHRGVRPIGAGRKLLLVAACCLAIAAPVVSGALRARPGTSAGAPAIYDDVVGAPSAMKFAEVTIKADPEATAKLKGNSAPIVSQVIWKDGVLDAKGVTLHSLVTMAYRPIQHLQITGGPDWINTDVFDVQAKASTTVSGAWQNMSQEQRDQAEESMVRNLLAQNFGVKIHRELRVEPIYVLVVDDAGKLQAFDGDCPPASSEAPQVNRDPRTMTPRCGNIIGMPGEMRANRVPIASLLMGLSLSSGRIVQDRTNLTKKYVVNLKFAPDPTLGPPPPPGFAPLPVVGPERPTLFDALVQQAGLRLVPQTGPVNMLVIDDAAMPGQGSENGR